MSYTESQARIDITAYFHSLWSEPELSEFSIYGENLGKPDVTLLTKILEFDIEFQTAVQATINNDDPVIRTKGKVVFSIGVKEGQGTADLYAARDYLRQKFKAKWLGSVRTEIPRPDGKFNSNGWVIALLAVPFRFDSNSVYEPAIPDTP